MEWARTDHVHLWEEDLYEKVEDKQKKAISADAAIEEHYWALCALLDIFCYFYLECPLSDQHPVPCSGLVRNQQGENSQRWILAQESSGTGGVGALNFHPSKHPSPCFAPGVFFIFLLFEGGSPHFAISCTRDNNISQGSPVLLCQKEKREFK